jgi:REP element-mobilizing transposase RayT
VHITLRVVENAPDLRSDKVFREVRRVFERARESSGFRLTSYSVQSNHIHLIVEAANKEALSRGMRSIGIRLARRINLASQRKGRLIAERYHARPLRSPTQVRNALLYVLRNSHHHERSRGRYLPPWYFDPCSSALEFDGFNLHPEIPDPKFTPRTSTVEPLFSYLLRTGWKRRGLLELTETPA